MRGFCNQVTQSGAVDAKLIWVPIKEPVLLKEIGAKIADMPEGTKLKA
jgi:hypothetical protein